MELLADVPCRLADIGDKRLLDRHVNVLVVDIEGKFSCFDARLDAIEPRYDKVHVLQRNNSLRSQHACMRLGPGDILRVQLLVNRQ